MTRQYFGTDGIRGTVGEGVMTADFALKLGHAVGRQLLRAHRGEKRPMVVIGKDTRISGYMLESAMESGFNSAGVDVTLLGPLPTPGVAYITRALRADLGVVISASHNPYPDNGIKFFSSAGAKLDDAWEAAVEAELAVSPVWASSHELGKSFRLDDVAGRYIEFCKGSFSSKLSLKGLKIVVDAAHGAAYQIAPAVLHELGAEVVKIGCSPDGTNINDGVGATAPQALVEAVKLHQADLGIALDGDADRLQMVDAAGRLYNGDELLYLMVMERIARGEKLEGAVGTLMTNMAVEVALKERGVGFVRAKVGDRYVLEELVKRGWILGGEGSGHLLVLDKHSTGDAMVSALAVLQAMQHAKLSLSKLLGTLRLFPQVLINVKLKDGADWQSNTALKSAQRDVEAQLGSAGRILIRKSGTEAKVRVMVEAQDAALAQRCAEQLAACLA